MNTDDNGLTELELSDDPHDCRRLDISNTPCIVTLSKVCYINKLFINWISNMLDRNMLHLLMNGNCPYIFYTMILDHQVIVKSITDPEQFSNQICKHFWINLDCWQGFHCR